MFKNRLLMDAFYDKKRRITLYSSRIILILYENYLHDKTYYSEDKYYHRHIQCRDNVGKNP